MPYIAIDLKSFYASVECVERGLDPLKARLVVADESRTEKTICLAVSPALKAYGIPGRPRLFEVVQKVREINRRQPNLHLDYIVAKPRMAHYIEYSTRIVNIYLRFVSSDDIHVYSVDEVFIDATGYLATYKMTAHELAEKMIHTVLQETGITATAGIGTNLYLAKVAMDIMAKHIPADKHGVRIAELDEMSYRRELWDYRPITAFWRIGRGIAAKLEQYRIYTMGDLARFSLNHDEVLYREFGVNAELLIDHAWGWEPCTIKAIKEYRPKSSSIGHGQVLKCPYNYKKACVVVREMADRLSLKLVENKLLAQGITLTIGYDNENLSNPEIRKLYTGPVSFDHYGRHVPKPAHGSERLSRPLSASHIIIDTTLKLMQRIADQNLLIRRINLTMTNLIAEEEQKRIGNAPIQLDLFADNEAELEKQRVEKELEQRDRRMQEAVIAIKKRFGKNAILKGTNFEEGATAIERNDQIGGHKA